ncbi:MAG TPA: ion channel [Polyangia bacterium]|nr:ion channel [Polyangia bacterium]
MKRPRRSVRFVPPGANYGIRVLGDERAPLRDFYHALLRLPWRVTVAAISGVFLAVNALFALGYLVVGGVAHGAPGSFADAFFFSVQTMGTIGYGNLYPESMAANVLVVAESIASLTLTALATGLVFAKFSRSTARLVFTKHAVISPVNGVPTLQFRLGNQRGNQIVDARIRVVMMRTEKLLEGGTFYRMLDLKLTRDVQLSLQRSWSALHVIDASSPLHGETPESFEQKEIELQVSVVGIDDITMQPVHGQHRYFTHQFLWGFRMSDILHEDPDSGDLVLDLHKFHHTEPSAPTDTFPYPRPSPHGASS